MSVRLQVGLRRLQRPDVRGGMCPVIFPVTLADTDPAKSVWATGEGVSVRDAVHAAVMLDNAVTQIATFDGGFDAIDGIERVPLA